ncbi:uncharacterized protein [Dysidea avara]
MEQDHSLTKTSILSLPMELLVIIMSHLTSLRDRVKLRYVSQRLQSVSETPSLWRKFVWDYYDSREERCINNLLKTCGEHIKCLTFLGYVVPYTLVEMLQYCNNVRYLSLTLPVGTVLHPDQLVEAVQHMKDLQILDIPWEVDIKPLLLICSSLKELTVYVHKSEGISSDVWVDEWVSIGFRPPNLSIVFISNQLPLTHELVQKWQLWNTKLPIDHTAHLKLYVRFKIPLSISPTLPAFQLQFSPTAVLPFVQANHSGIPGLDIQLQLTDRCSGNKTVCKATKVIGAYPSVHRVTSLHSVTHFDITRYSALLSNHLEQLAIACPNLQQLKLRNCYECLKSLQGLNAIANYCPNLQGLNILGISITRLESQNRLWEILSNLKLTHLGVEFCVISPCREDTVYQEKMIFLYQRCLSLLALESLCNVLSCIDCRLSNVKDSLLLSHFPSLKYCKLSNRNCTSVQDIISSCNKLQCLKVRNSMSTSKKLSLSVAHNHNLQQLFIHSIFTAIPDSFISSCSAHGGLIHVFLRVATLSIAGIKALIENSPKLLTFQCVLEICDKYNRQLPKEKFLEFTDKLKQEFSSRRLFYAGSYRLFQQSDHKIAESEMRLWNSRFLEYTDLHNIWDASF